MGKEKILAPLVPGTSLIPGIPSLPIGITGDNLAPGASILENTPILGDLNAKLPGNPVDVGRDLARGKPFQSLIDRSEGLVPKAPKVPPLPPVLPAPAPLPPTQRGSDVEGQAVGAARQIRSTRGRNVFNVGGSRGVGSVSPLARGGRRQLGA